VDWAEHERELAELRRDLAAWESSPEHQRFLADLERQGAADLAELQRVLASPEHQRILADLERDLAAGDSLGDG
jgi:hypothetical protein